MQLRPALKIHFVLDKMLQIKFENPRQSASIQCKTSQQAYFDWP